MTISTSELAELFDLDEIPDLQPGQDRYAVLFVGTRPDPEGPDPDVDPKVELIPAGANMVGVLESVMGIAPADLHILTGTTNVETERVGAVTGVQLLALANGDPIDDNPDDGIGDDPAPTPDPGPAGDPDPTPDPDSDPASEPDADPPAEG